MNPHLRIEVEIIVGKLEETYGPYGDFLDIDSKDNNYRLRMLNSESKNSLVIFMITNTVESIFREIQNEVSQGSSDILVVGYLDSDEKNQITRFLPNIEGNLSYSLLNYSSILWNDNRIRHTSKAGLFLLKKEQAKRNVILNFTPQIHPGVSLVYEKLSDREKNMKRYIPGRFSTSVFVRFEKKLRPIWNLLPLPARRLVKRLSHYV